ncbi:unnamed protein product [Parascedosporium putredinis]|uniref:DNA repair protein Rad26 n=1 Tax=Parascedosporium putredinis TaxID=1442378 RepID=A0A9P1H0G8_9PEZI|nr:unnamed protein product [Parascedosporium putredinis]CAI7991796.1 unnamed protein product [Parascedosporium putredinis]
MGEYSDDDLDDLPESVFQELESKAIEFTQRQQQLRSTQAKEPPHQPTRPHTTRTLDADILDNDDDDEDDLFILDASEAVRNAPAVSRGRRSLSRPPCRRFTDPVTWQGPDTLTPIPITSNGTEPEASPAPTPIPRAFAPLHPLRSLPDPGADGRPQSDAVSALQLRVRNLERELNMAKGEAAILRSNSTKAQQAHDAELARLKKQAKEHMDKQDRAMERALEGERQKATELQFIQRDMHMQEVANRARRKETGATATTPKKTTRSWGVADGFDGMDLVPSPSKSNNGRAKQASGILAQGERTPSKNKRKRPTVDSPVPPLDTTTTDDVVMLPDIVEVQSTSGSPPTFDNFSRYFFPSDPNTSFSSIIFQSLPTKTDPSNPMNILTEFSLLIIDLWNRCVEEALFGPIRELVSLLSFTLQLHSVSIIPRLLNRVLAIAQATLFVLIDLRSQATDREAETQEEDADYPTTSILALLSLFALVSATGNGDYDGDDDDDEASSSRVSFWKLFALDSVCLVLGPKQPLYDIAGMLDLLTTSVLPGSIGPIAVDKDPPVVADIMLDKLSKLLVHLPVAAKTPAQRHAMMRLVLQTMLSFTASEFGMRQIALNESAALRVIVALSKAVDELYDQNLTVDALSLSSLRIRDARRAEILDQSFEAPATGMTTAHIIRLQEKFETWRSDGRRCLTMLCRLNFAEDDLVLEAGIDSETAERAHELLEVLVTPEKGKNIGEAFGTPDE